MSDPYYSDTDLTAAESSISLTHIVRTLAAYRWAILLPVVAVTIVYTIIAVSILVLSPAQRVTTQQFRLEFKGASEGRYPNDREIRSDEMVATPVLLRVYKRNELQRFTTFAEFSRSVYVLSSNPEYDRIAADFESRLSDQRLAPADRERIQKEWEATAQTLPKSGYSVNYQRRTRSNAVPEDLVRKVLGDILYEWANIAAQEQKVLNYSLDLLSPTVLDENRDLSSEPIITLVILRSKVNRIIRNAVTLGEIPGSVVLRTRSGGRLSLGEIRVRLAELIRFRIDPTLLTILMSNLIHDRVSTIQFLESQLAFDERQLEVAQSKEASIRESLALYASPRPSDAGEHAAGVDRTTRQSDRSETLTPQLDGSFFERLLKITGAANGAEYRRRLVDELRAAAVEAIPLTAAVEYDRALLEYSRKGGVTSAANAPAVQEAIAKADAEARELLGQMNEIYDLLTYNRNPARDVYSVTSPPFTHVSQPKSGKRLALIGVAITFVTLLLTIAAAFAHARFSDEEVTEGLSAPARGDAS